MKIGDQIVVKDGTEDPDFNGKYLSGYTGSIENIDEDNLVGILWDDSTIMRFDSKFKKKCDRKNLDYTRMVLYTNEIEVIKPK